MKTLLYILLYGALSTVFIGILYMLYTVYLLAIKPRISRYEVLHEIKMTQRYAYRVKIKNDDNVALQPTYTKNVAKIAEDVLFSNASEGTEPRVKFEIPQYVYSMANDHSLIMEFVEKVGQADKDTKFKSTDYQQRSVVK